MNASYRDIRQTFLDMLSNSIATATFAGILISSILYIAYSYFLTHIPLALHLKRKRYARCPYYQHTDILFGSDYQTALGTAITTGTRKQWYRSQFAKYGKTFEANVWGRRIFQTCDAANAQALLTASPADVGAGPSRAGLLAWLGPGVFTIDGEAWKRSRDLLKPVFRKTALEDMGRLEKHLGRLLDEVEREGFEVDLQALFMRMFLDFTMELLIGEDVHSIINDTSKIDLDSFLAACDQSQLQVVRSSQPWIVRWWKGWTKTWDQPLHATQNFVARYVESAVQDVETAGGPIKRTPAFLDHLIAEAGTKDQDYLRDQILNVFMPGRDSTTIMISYVMFYLARNPAVYGKVREEVLAAGFEKEGISYEALKNLRYTNAVVTESLRVSGPPNGQTVRDVLSDIVLPRGGGANGDQPILVPKGSAVWVQIQTLHRDQTAWGPDADDFRPERWIEMSKAPQRLAFEYMPFGGGRRICPAMALVMGELVYIVVSFALRFREIQNRDPEEDMKEEGAIVMKLRNGVQVKLVQ